MLSDNVTSLAKTHALCAFIGWATETSPADLYDKLAHAIDDKERAAIFEYDSCVPLFIYQPMQWATLWTLIEDTYRQAIMVAEMAYKQGVHV